MGMGERTVNKMCIRQVNEGYLNVCFLENERSISSIKSSRVGLIGLLYDSWHIICNKECKISSTLGYVATCKYSMCLKSHAVTLDALMLHSYLT